MLRIPTTSSYWKGEVFAYGGLPQNLKDLKDVTYPLVCSEYNFHAL